ncbi:porin family protein [Devosia sp. YIM 151766]|uniref:outer membrane protein n=1 Tax=Devosia sp. YIM 151766 TaxID=3017325 RepID=UPI00255CD52D|nr:porin family protein [Devosia sp. YIM 151766]WIY54433.1 porin family protein [Devosia sp. YIM 151766]
MPMIHKIALVSALCSVSVSAALAADVITVPTSSQAALPIHEESGFDWSGFYAGIYGSIQNGSAGGMQYGAGLNAGVNTQFDFYLLGAEVAVHGLADDGTGEPAYGQILGRAGLVVSDDVLLYGAGGYGIDLGAPAEADWLAGGGVELAITDAFSVRAQYLHSFPAGGGNAGDQFTLGANFHF